MVEKWKRALPVALTVVCLLCSLELRRCAISRFDRVLTDDDRFYLPPARWMRLFCLGYNEAVADLVWVKSILYFGRHVRIKEGERFVMSYIDTAITLDPRFRTLYLAGSVLTLYQNNGKPSKKSLDMAIDILERGHLVFPNDGEIAFDLGFMHYSDMTGFVPEDRNDPATLYHTTRGRRLIGESALMPGAPPYAAMLSVALYSDDIMADLKVDHLEALLAKETQPEIRQTLIDNLRKALGNAAERDIRTTNRLQREWRREMPYIPYDLYLLLHSDYTTSDLIDPLDHFDRLIGLYDEETDRAGNARNAEER